MNRLVIIGAIVFICLIFTYTVGALLYGETCMNNYGLLECVKEANKE